MDMKIKPLMIACAIALGVSSTAYAQGAGAGAAGGSAGDTGGTGAAGSAGTGASGTGDAGGNTNSRVRRPGAVDNSVNSATTTDPSAQLRSNSRAGMTSGSSATTTKSDTTGKASASGMTGSGSMGANPAFDSEEEVNGRAVPGSPSRPLNDKTSKAGTAGKANMTSGSPATTMTPDKTGTMPSSRMSGSGRTEANPAFDSQEEVNGRAVPGSPSHPLNVKTSKAGMADAHTSTMGKTNSAHPSTTARSNKAAHANDAQVTAKSGTSTRSTTGADKSDAENSAQHRTDEPFRDDVGRIPGANPDAGTASTSGITAK